jgi:hypothetical protein
MLPQPYETDTTQKYGDYLFEEFGYMKPPKPSKNGGLYTGEEFKKGAQYADIDVIPDAFFMNNFTLSSAKPPPGAMGQSADNIRPGNNKQVLANYDKHAQIYCHRSSKSKEEICAFNFFDNSYGSLL